MPTSIKDNCHHGNSSNHPMNNNYDSPIIKMQLHFDPAAPETVLLPIFQILENIVTYISYT